MARKPDQDWIAQTTMESIILNLPVHPTSVIPDALNQLRQSMDALRLDKKQTEGACVTISSPSPVQVSETKLVSMSVLQEKIWPPQVVDLIQQQDEQLKRRPFRKIENVLLCIIHHLWVLMLFSVCASEWTSQESLDKKIHEEYTCLWSYIHHSLIPLFWYALQKDQEEECGWKWMRHLWITTLGQSLSTLPDFRTFSSEFTHANRRMILEVAELVHLQSITTVAQMRRSVYLALQLFHQKFP